MISCADRSFVRIGLICTLFCAAAACGSGGSYVWVHDRPPMPQSDGRTLIGPGDLIEVQVYGDEQGSTTGRVLADGTITIPLLGAVPVVGKRPEELAAAVTFLCSPLGSAVNGESMKVDGGMIRSAV